MKQRGKGDTISIRTGWMAVVTEGKWSQLQCSEILLLILEEITLKLPRALSGVCTKRILSGGAVFNFCLSFNISLMMQLSIFILLLRLLLPQPNHNSHILFCLTSTSLCLSKRNSANYNSAKRQCTAWGHSAIGKRDKRIGRTWLHKQQPFSSSQAACDSSTW